jgi:hypothetical protein
MSKDYHGPLPVTSSDKKMAKKHLKATIKLEKQKVKDHVKAAKKGPQKSKAYNMGHAKAHQKDISMRKKSLKTLKSL